MRNQIVNNPYKSIPIVQGLRYYVWQGTENNCNSVLFTDVLAGPRPHLLVDPGGCFTPETARISLNALKEALAIDGYPFEKVGLIVATHYHNDHCLACDLLPANGPLVAYTREDFDCREKLDEGIYRTYGANMPHHPLALYLQEGWLELGNPVRLRLQVFHTPGHSPGGISLYWPAQKVLISGDTVFAGSVGRTDFPGGSATDLKKSIERLSKLEIDYLLPGHSTESGSFVSGRQAVNRNFETVKLYVT